MTGNVVPFINKKKRRIVPQPYEALEMVVSELEYTNLDEDIEAYKQVFDLIEYIRVVLKEVEVIVKNNGEIFIQIREEKTNGT